MSVFVNTRTDAPSPTVHPKPQKLVIREGSGVSGQVAAPETE